MIGTARARRSQPGSRERILLLLLQRARRAMADADVHLAASRVTDASLHLERARDVVAELRDSLDRRKAPAIADSLGALYGFILDRLRVAQSGNREALQDAQLAFAPIADAFEQAVTVHA